MSRPASAASSAPGSGSSGRKRSWSTPWGTTWTGPEGGQISDSLSAVLALTHTSASAWRAATRMARRKNGTRVRWCHSGWSKKVRSWMVTTRGRDDASGIV